MRRTVSFAISRPGGECSSGKRKTAGGMLWVEGAASANHLTKIESTEMGRSGRELQCASVRNSVRQQHVSHFATSAVHGPAASAILVSHPALGRAGKYRRCREEQERIATKLASGALC